MRAPDTINVDIDDVRWQQIRDVCRRNGVDADKIMVRKTPLRTKLQRLATRYVKCKTSKSPTERQCNEVIAEGLAKIAAFRDQYTKKRDADGHEYGGDMIAYFASHGVIKKVLGALDELETELRSSLVAKPLRESNAAERERDHYWFQLRSLWMKSIAPHTRKRKPLADFLEVATGASLSAIKNFLDRLSRKAHKAHSFDDYPGYL